MSSPLPEPSDEDNPGGGEWELALPDFEGPLDLLLELVRDHEIDVAEISVAEITDQYLACIERMEELDLQVSAEWLEMAARLMELKSRALVPDDDEEEEEGPDPRDELVRQLVAYEKYKMLAEKLDGRPTLGDTVFPASERLDRFRSDTGPPEIEGADPEALLGVLEDLLAGTEDEEEFLYEMSRETIEVRAVVVDVARRLRDQPRLRFEELFDEASPSRNRVVTTFFALLEMTRLELVQLDEQRLGDRDELYIERSVLDIVDVSRTLDLPEFG